MELRIPLEARSEKTTLVDETLTAAAIGSGDLNVLATPMMIALMESAALDAVRSYLPEGWTTVGTGVDIEHLRSTPPGEPVTALAVLNRIEGHTLYFRVTARDGRGIIGQGSHRRAAVDVDRFMSGIGGHP